MDETMAHIEAQHEVLCKNCQHEIDLGAMYCNACGQKVILHRLSVKAVLKDVFASITNVESGFWYSLKMLIIRPDEYLSDYLGGGTRKYTNVFRLIFLLSALSLLLASCFGLMEPLIKISTTKNDSEEVANLIKLMQNYSMYLTFLMIPFFAIVSYWVFKKRNLYYAEHLVLNSIWLSGYTLLGIFTLVLLPFMGKDKLIYYGVLNMILFFGYFIYANKKYFGLTWLRSILVSTLHFIIGNVLYGAFLMGFMGLLGLVFN